MYKYVLALTLVTSIAHANNCNDNSGNTNTNIIIGTVASAGQLPQSSASSNTNDDNTARSGCCSHHKGVCGCSNGRAVCCDGSYSPSCGCN